MQDKIQRAGVESQRASEACFPFLPSENKLQWQTFHEMIYGVYPNTNEKQEEQSLLG